MRIITKEQIDALRSRYPAGTRVALLQMDDVQAPPIGTKGTVTGVDDTGSLLVDWDNGSGLNVLYGIDLVRKKPPAHWIEENTRPKSFKWICSECGSTVYDMPMCNKKNYKKMCLYQYCPYCGVRMDLSEVAE